MMDHIKAVLTVGILAIQLLVNMSSSEPHLLHYDQAISSSAFGEPVFRLEPPNVVNFANTKGTIIPCLVSGSPRPKITWYTTNVGDMGQQSSLSGDMSLQQSRLVNNVTNLRKITQNGAALILLPFKETDFRQEIHSTEYRCVASNYLATIHSRSALVQAVISSRSGVGAALGKPDEVKVNDEFVTLNSPAVLKCRSNTESEFSQLVEWFTSDGIQVGAGETSKGNKFTAFRSGELHVASVDLSDLQRTYGCRLRNSITNKLSSSSGLAQLILTESSTGQLEGRRQANKLEVAKESSVNQEQFGKLQLSKQSNQVLHSVSQLVASDSSDQQQHRLPSGGSNEAPDKRESEWRLLLPCALRLPNEELGNLSELRWFFQPPPGQTQLEGGQSLGNERAQKELIPLEQFAAASSIPLHYLTLAGSQNLSSSGPATKPATRTTKLHQDKSTKYFVASTFLAIEWPTRAQSGRYVCQLISSHQSRPDSSLARTVCDINVIIRQPIELKVEAALSGKWAPLQAALSTSSFSSAPDHDNSWADERGERAAKEEPEGGLLSRAVSWFGFSSSSSSSERELTRAAISAGRSQREKRAASEEDSGRIQVRGAGVVQAPPVMKVGERLQLDCFGSGHPIEIVKWFKNGRAINTQSSSDFQVEIRGRESLQEQIESSSVKKKSEEATSGRTLLSSLLIRQLQPRDAGLHMFECFAYNSFGDKARAGLALVVLERQLAEWARSVCLVMNTSTSTSGAQEDNQDNYLADYSELSQDQDFVPSWRMGESSAISSFANILRRLNPFKRALLLESEPAELSCLPERFSRLNSPKNHASASNSNNMSARLEWRRWKPTAGPESNKDGNNREEPTRESRNFNQLFSGDSRFLINGSSLQIRSPSKRHDEAVYVCRLALSLARPSSSSSSSQSQSQSQSESENENELASLVRQSGGKSLLGQSDSEQDLLNFFSTSSSQARLLDLNSVHQSSLASSNHLGPSPSFSNCANSMLALFAQPTNKQDFLDQVGPNFGLAMSSISIRIVAKPKIDPFEFSRTLEEGMRAVVVCAVISGNSPVDVAWFKDGQLLVEEEQGEEEEQEESLSVDQANGFSSTLTFHRIKASHSGLYTCVAANAFAATNHTSRLTVNVAPYFIDAPKNTRAVLNTNVLVNCRAGGQPTPQIRWRKLVPIAASSPSLKALATPSGGKLDFYSLNDLDNLQMAPSSQLHNQLPNGAQSGKYEFRVITSNSHIQILENGSMIIKDVELSDSSRYVCQAFNGINPSLSEVIDLAVLSPAQFDVNYETISVKRDAMIKFNCAPKGDQPMRVEWRKEGIPMVAVEEVLGSSGNFQESANIGSKQSKYSQVAYFANLSASANSELVKQKVSNLLVQKEASSVISENGTTGSQLEGLKSSELFINYADRTDTGTFVCVARNAYGKDELTYRLVVQEAPDVPLNLNAHSIQANSLKLSWLAPFDGNLPLSHFVIEYRKTSSTCSTGASSIGAAGKEPLPVASPLQLSETETGTGASSRHASEWVRLLVSTNKLSVETLTPSIGLGGQSQAQTQSQSQSQKQFSVVLRQLTGKTTYQIRVAAVNGIGQSGFSPHLCVTTAEEPPSSRPNDVRVQPLSSSSIKVLWRGPAVIDEQAPIRGYYVSHRKLATSKESTQEQATATSSSQLGAGGSNWIGSQSISAANSSYQDSPDESAPGLRRFTGGAGSWLNSAQSGRAEQSGNQAGANYELLIGHLEKNTKYEVRVQAYNAMGVGPGSEAVGQTLKFDRPGQPNLKLVGARRQSFELKWTLSDEQPLMGFSLFYKAEYDDWQEIQLGIIYHYVIDNLRCGNKYQIYLSAFNVVGRSDPSDVLSVRTEGTVPIAPDKSQFFKSNITEVVLDMSGWQSGGCPISSFMIQFKRLHESNWFILSEGATPFANSDKITIPDLAPATWYKLLVTALNEAGSTNAEYLFSTLNLNGEQIAATFQLEHENNRQQSNWLGSSNLAARSIWSSISQLLFPAPATSSQHNNESGQLLLPMSCILLLLVASLASYLYYSKSSSNSSSPNSSSNGSNFSNHSATLKNCYQANQGLVSQMQGSESANTTLARARTGSCNQNLDEKQLIAQPSRHFQPHLELENPDQVMSSSHQPQHPQSLPSSMLDSLLGSAAGLQTFVGNATASRPQRAQHGMKLLPAANIFANNNNTPNSNCTSSSISTHSTNCFEGSTASSSGTSSNGLGSKAKLQLIDESSMISEAIEEHNNNKGNLQEHNGQFLFDTSKPAPSSPSRTIYSALRANNHIELLNQAAGQSQLQADNSTFGELFNQSQPEQARLYNSFANQRLLSTSFASAADLLHRQQQQQQPQVYYQQHQEEPIYQRLDKLQSYQLPVACKQQLQQQQQQQFAEQAARSQTLRFNNHFSIDDPMKSLTLHRQTFHNQLQPQVVEPRQAQFPSNFYDQSATLTAIQSGGMYQAAGAEQELNYEQQAANNSSEINQHIMGNNQQQ